MELLKQEQPKDKNMDTSTSIAVSAALLVTAGLASTGIGAIPAALAVAAFLASSRWFR